MPLSSAERLALPLAPSVKKKDPAQKAYDFFIPEREEQEAIKAGSHSKIEDIVSFLENIARPGYAILGGLHEISKEGEQEPGEVFEAMKKGFTLEEKHTLREIMKNVQPDTMKWIEENTSVRPFGIRMDIATPFLFAGELGLDPVTFIPFGWITKGMKIGVEGLAKGARVVAEKVIGAEKTAKIIDDVTENFLKPIYGNFNIRALFKTTKAVGGGKAPTDDLVLAFQRAKSVAEARAEKFGKQVNMLGGTAELVTQVQKIMTGKQGKQLGQALHIINDEAVKALGEFHAKRLGIAVEDVSDFWNVQSIIDELGLYEGGSREANILLKELEGKLAIIKSSTAKEVTKYLLEERGMKHLANKLGSVEKQATEQYAKANIKATSQLFRETFKQIDNEINTIKLSLKSDIGLSGKMLSEEVNQSLQAVSKVGNDFTTYFKSDSSPEMLAGLKQSFAVLKSKIAGLDKYQLDITKGIIKQTPKMLRSGERLGQVHSLLKNLEIDIGRERIGTISKTGAQISQRIGKDISSLKRELGLFNLTRKAEFGTVEGSLKASGQLQKEIVDSTNKRLGELFKNKASLEKELRKETVRTSVAMEKGKALAKERAKGYYEIFSKLNSAKYFQETIEQFKTTADNIWQKNLAELPKELQGPAMRFRRILDEYKVKLGEGTDPLLNHYSPLYAPRMVQDQFLEEVRRVIPGVSTRSFGNFKNTRTFQTSEESVAWAKKHGVEIEDDAAKMIWRYSQKAEMALAKHTFEQGLVNRLGLESMSDLPKEYLKAIDYLYRGGISKFSNPVIETGFKVYGGLLHLTKTMLTVMNPAFHVRNVMSMPFQIATTAGMKQGMNPANFVDATLIMMGKKGSIKSAGKDISFESIRKLSEDTGYFAQSWFRGDMGQNMNTALGRYSPTSLKGFIGKIFRWSMQVEDMGRMAGLVANLKNGKPFGEAAELARKALFDYNLINSPVDKALQGVFGFYTFTRRNLPRQVATLFNDPKQFAIISRTMNKISNREMLTDEEVESMQDFDRESFKIFGEVVDGVREFVAFGFTPTEEAYHTLNSITSMDLQKIMGGRISPLLGSFLDWAYKKDSFYNKDFGNSLPSGYSKIIPKAAWKALGLTPRERDKYRGGQIVGKETVLYGDPDKIAFIRKTPFWSRQINDIARLAQSVEEGKGKQGLRRYVTGLRTREIDLEKSRKQKKAEEREAMEKELKKRGALIIKRPFVPKTYKESYEKEMETINERLSP